MQRDKFNPSYTSARKSLLKHIKGENLTILDVGCATGSNGQFLLDKGIAAEVHGFEYDQDMAAHARKVYTEVHSGDIESLDLNNLLNNHAYDYIILGDILEHLKNPWTVLKELTSFLKNNGVAIISLPNIQHIDVFLHIYIKGIWPYNERGIFDKTHLRFFTHKTMINLINDAGLDIIKTERLYRLRDRKGSKFKYSPIEGILRYLLKNLYTFQFIFICKKNNKTT